jgi:membrane fusion protein, multidrug efflux system
LPPPEGRKPGAQSSETHDKPTSFRDRLRQHRILVATAACLSLVAAVVGLLYWLSVRDYESTDDAFVAARSFSIAPKVGGYITDVPVTDNQHVAAGELLAKVDDRDYRIAVDQAKAQVAVAGANIINFNAQIDSQQEQIKQAKAQVDQAEAQLQFARQEEARAKDLVDKACSASSRRAPTCNRSKPTRRAPRPP